MTKDKKFIKTLDGEKYVSGKRIIGSMTYLVISKKLSIEEPIKTIFIGMTPYQYQAIKFGRDIEFDTQIQIFINDKGEKTTYCGEANVKFIDDDLLLNVKEIGFIPIEKELIA